MKTRTTSMHATVETAVCVLILIFCVSLALVYAPECKAFFTDLYESSAREVDALTAVPQP